MSKLRDVLVAEIRNHADAEGDKRWSSTNILAALDMAYRREWRRILNANRFYRVAERTPTLTAGRFALDALDGGTGDTAESHYRILSVSRGVTPYREIQATDFVAGEDAAFDAAFRSAYFRVGDYIRVVPSSGETLTVTVNHIPPLPSVLSSGSVSVVFPSGYESVPCMEAAAIILSKGGAETEASGYLKALAEEVRRDMLSDIARTSTNPIQMGYSDTAGDWAG